ncbi:MAG: hypothetical protein JXD18_01045 [Anaerolineae bacterium]|nr:hypothetical protein [Anaerolineae bacterium]
MDHVKVLKRAFEITWRYRALWIFGIILALTTASGGGNSGGGGSGGGGGGGNGGSWIGDGWGLPGYEFPGGIAASELNIIIGIAAALGCVILILIAVSTIARWVAETSLIRMVNDHEETDGQRSVKEGFRMGWSRSALRLFLIDLLITLTTVVVFILLLLVVAAPFLVWILEDVTIGIIGSVVGAGLFFLYILLAIVVGTVLNVLSHFFRRVCVLEETEVIDSIRKGYAFVRRHVKDVAVMWFIMFGITLAWTFAMIFVSICVFLFAGIIAAIPGVLIGLGAYAVLGEAAGWIAGGVVGGLIFVLAMVIPLIFVGGLAEVFKSTVWTLTYRELRVLDGAEPELEEIGEA